MMCVDSSLVTWDQHPSYDVCHIMRVYSRRISMTIDIVYPGLDPTVGVGRF